MKLIVNNTNDSYSFSGIYCAQRNKNTGTYYLSGISTKLLSVAKNSLINKSNFDCSIQDENSTILIGEGCWFNDLDPIGKKVSLIVNWVEKDNI